MAALGELQADVAIHADTYWEKSATYAFIRRWQPWLEEKGLRVVTVGDPVQAVEKVATSRTDMPAFSRKSAFVRVADYDERDEPFWIEPPQFMETTQDGQLRRQCTQRWKVEPIRRWLRAEFERLGVLRGPGCVVSIQGISLDEYTRMRDSDVQWIVNEYPLVDRRMTRADCAGWLERNGLEIPPKSACVFCPFQGRESWQALKRTDPAGWRQAIEVDEAIRDVRPPFQLFVHRKRIPLVDAVKTEIDAGYSQASLLDDNAGCDSGYCFV